MRDRTLRACARRRSVSARARARPARRALALLIRRPVSPRQRTATLRRRRRMRTCPMSCLYLSNGGSLLLASSQELGSWYRLAVSIVRLSLCPSLSCDCELLFFFSTHLPRSSLYTVPSSCLVLLRIYIPPGAPFFPIGRIWVGGGERWPYIHLVVYPPSHRTYIHHPCISYSCRCPQIDDRSIRCASCTRRRLRRSRTVGSELAHTILLPYMRAASTPSY